MTPNGPKPKIVIADDDVVSRRVLETFVGKRGYDVVCSANGQTALAILSAENAPRLAILDWMMPGMEGPEICRRLREQSSERPYVYVLMLTARTQTEDLVRGLQSGADDYITKPFDPTELDARLKVGLRILDLQDKLIAAREELRFQATHDTLTGLANRGVILETLQGEHARQRRKGGSFGIILMDVDRFKKINDTYGHLFGDTVLRQVTRIMKTTVRPYDTVGRYGGEEFLVVLPESDALAARNVGERLRKAIESQPVLTPDGEVLVTASFGVAASLQARPLDPESLLSLADDALYRAKRGGRNRVELGLYADPAPLESLSR